MKIEKAIKYFASDLKEIENAMRVELASDIPVIPEIIGYVITSGGKRFRPLLLLATAGLYGYRGKDCYPLAAIIEFVHTATLLHDDVIDEAKLRRGKESANRRWGNAAPVLVGDFLFSTSFGMMAAYATLPIIKIMANTTSKMAEGEMYQLLMRGNPATSEDDYNKIVERKTAVLISAACTIGAKLGKAPTHETKRLFKFGHHVGMAFQIADDALDYCASQEIFGKELNKDLSEGKMTLPLIYALQNCTGNEKKFATKIIARKAIYPTDTEKVLSLVSKYRGVEYARAKALAHIKIAAKLLEPFPNSTEKETLLAVADYAATRNR